MKDKDLEIGSEYTHRLLSCAYNVHSTLGSGLLESVYEKALFYELQLQGFDVKSQMPLKVNYRDITLDLDLRLDIIVDNKVILELKSVQELSPVYYKQLQTYLRLTKCELGYLINFNVAHLKNGIKREINAY
ncbi:MAG: GxxExxY protein [Prevotella sp.]|nr:GxxExxY protein [Prevotella sp.]